MKKWIWVLAAMLVSSSAPAQTMAPTQTMPPPAHEPVCEPIGRTSKGDLVYSILCRNIPGLAAGENGYNPLPKEVPAPPSPPNSAPKAPASK